MPAVGLAIALAGAVLAGAPQAPQAPTFRRRVDLVRIDVSVLDDAGRVVPGLEARDFIVRDNDRDVVIDIVTEVRLAPPVLPAAWMRRASGDVSTNDRVEGKRLIALVIDEGRFASVGSMRDRVRGIARDVIDRLGPDDLAAVIFPVRNEFAQDFTSDRALLLDAIDAIGQGWVGTPVFEPYSLDVLSRICAALAAVPTHRKVLIYIGGGHRIHVQPGGGSKHVAIQLRLDPWGLAGRTDALMREAQKAGIALFMIDPRRSNPFTRGRIEDVFMEDVARHTGGFAIVNTDEFVGGIDRIFEQTGHYYIIGFRPPEEARSGILRRLEVQVRYPNATVRAQTGYYAPRVNATASALSGDRDDVTPGGSVTRRRFAASPGARGRGQAKRQRAGRTRRHGGNPYRAQRGNGPRDRDPRNAA